MFFCALVSISTIWCLTAAFIFSFHILYLCYFNTGLYHGTMSVMLALHDTMSVMLALHYYPQLYM